MRSFVDGRVRLVALGLATAALTGCGAFGGGDRPVSLADAGAATAQGVGPAADYPVVLGSPFTVEGELYTPADTLNYDSVGYAGADDGNGVTAAHRTLPLPSYAEVTSLESGKTILVRVERRGPMTGKSLVSLSSSALAQLGAAEGTPVRLRRVNPPEAQRAELRAGRAAPDRIDTPKTLVEVLRRKLPASGTASLRAAAAPAPALAALRPTQPVRASQSELPPVVAISNSPASAPNTVGAYPLPPMSGREPARTPVVVAQAETIPATFRIPGMAQPTLKPAPSAPAALQPAPIANGAFVIQAGAFASQANAQRAAKALGGFVSPAGRLYRVRTGPFSSRGQAEAALAKVRAAGYSDARVTTSG